MAKDLLITPKLPEATGETWNTIFFIASEGTNPTDNLTTEF